MAFKAINKLLISLSYYIPKIQTAIYIYSYIIFTVRSNIKVGL